MRIFHVALAAAVTAAAGTLLVTPAQATSDSTAATTCSAEYNAHVGDGYVRAYDSTNCNTQIGAAAGDDANWNDVSGPFRSPSNDKATSLLNTGTYAGGVNNVQFWSNSGYGGYTGCLRWGELYVDTLLDNVLVASSGSINANNQISSHAWSSGCSNPLT
ncbi:hypothetical protein [Streptomyces sp. MMBL 11-3]|uniref:hypothetical protein n=1 Tax=Streptomyces sp. MMBL 11-3 TaxID=3382639 RepID=UPI0039B5AD77